MALNGIFAWEMLCTCSYVRFVLMNVTSCGEDMSHGSAISCGNTTSRVIPHVEKNISAKEFSKLHAKYVMVPLVCKNEVIIEGCCTCMVPFMCRKVRIIVLQN